MVAETERNPRTADGRHPSAEWKTVLKLSVALFVTSMTVSGLASVLFEIPIPIQDAPVRSLISGLAVSAPMLCGLAFIARSEGILARKLWTVPGELLGPALSQSSQAGLAGIALMAGVGEEILFRGLLHQWLVPLNVPVALIVPNLVFGALHGVNAVYAVAAGVTGLYFSILMHFVPGVTLASLMVAHAFYDYVALNCLRMRTRRPV